MLTPEGEIRPEVAAELSEENGVQIAKMAWLSDKTKAKEYGSMVIYVTKGSNASRLLHEGYFHLNGESAYTNVFKVHHGPIQCYNCQAIGHKAFSYQRTQVCAKCARNSHSHRDCIEVISKCVPCGGPHKSFSKNCRVLYPNRHE